METIKRFTWEVMPTSTPLFKRKCSKCKNSNLYYNSNKFRLNSQKKNIDVWLIYKCIKCDNTCNITILSRTKPELIDKELYQRFCMNDEETAWKYALDPEIIRKNNMELDYSNIEYYIVRENISFEEMLNMQEHKIEFEIRANWILDLKLTSLIKQCFDISSSQLERMLSAEVITIQPSVPLKKCKAKNGMIITVHKARLRTYLQGYPPNQVDKYS